MCLILFGFDPASHRPLLVAANRDEFHQRPSAQADFWHDHDHVMAGRDLEAGGTWLGCTSTGRFAALTNFSHPDDGPRPKSRGLLVQNFLTGRVSSAAYADDLVGEDYAGFNLIVFDGEELVYTSNKGHGDVLKPGYYGLSNAELGAEWPKCVQGAAALRSIDQDAINEQALIDLLSDAHVPPDEELPHRGRPLDMERRVAPCFIVGDEYGTRASTVVELGRDRIRFVEQSYAAAGEVGGRVRYEFDTES